MPNRESSSAKIAVIGIDIGKSTFDLIGQDARGAIVMRAKVSRRQLNVRLANIPPCIIGMEPCSRAHYVARRLMELGHDVRLVPGQYVKPFLKAHKNDYRDAEAVAEQTRIFRRFQEVFETYDLVLAPTVAVAPFPRETLYIDQIGDKKLNTYCHWPAMAWYITLTTNPAVSPPCGRDDNGLPFGLQVVGRFWEDWQLFDASAALESAFADNEELARPIPNIDRLREPVPALKSLVTDPPADQ